MAHNSRACTRLSMLVSKNGWRRTAIINTALAATCGFALLICFAISISQPGASILHPSTIFAGNCTTSARLNLFLHFLINVISTAILASSNFFMQILNAPSRREIDNAHSWLRSLDIGIPSIRNLTHVSKLKFASWLIFITTSLPIHLLFNSSVFETTYTGSRWYLALATSAFTQGATFFPPGASLSPAGSFTSNSGLGYGDHIPLDEYWNTSSAVRQKLASVAEESHSWTLLDSAQCFSETKYGDVVLILNATASEDGWARSDVFTLNPSSNLSTLWDIHVPPNAINSLWFFAPCNVSRERSSSGRDDRCANSCLGAMGLDNDTFRPGEFASLSNDPWVISFFPAVRNHQFTFDNGLKFNDKFDFFRVDHCLAQRIEPTCKVGLSNTLLLVVILSIMIKVIHGGVVTWKLQSTSLVTPGDAIESFILCPDPTTQGLGTLDIKDAQQLELGVRKDWSNTLDRSFTTKVKYRKWKKYLPRLWNIIPYSTWVEKSFIFLAGFVLLSVGFAVSSGSTRNNYADTLDHSNGVLTIDIAPQEYIATLLIANSPQLILSLCYFSYNSLLTQLNVEKEWNTFSVAYQPLRVSYPAGQQVSSYRLQLPYKHGVPLILISITLHWFVSNAVFLFVNEGGYWDTRGGITELNDQFLVADGSLVTIEHSPLFFLLLFITGFLFILVPPLCFASLRVKGDMVAGGWNSLVISAACHVPDSEHIQGTQPPASEYHSFLGEYARRESAETSCYLEDDEANYQKRLDLTRRKLRWGAIPLPKRIRESLDHGDQDILHLGFGGEEHDVSEPIDGQYYM
ncbi:hypothetical protein F5Y14DRAFT_464695 [Nemania sp. NC0429]|nr:hypothetical protein F5Y14DRAFT_464695 [Nemania sp. NC0429]